MGCENEESKIEPAEVMTPKDFNRFLPKDPRPYLDNLSYGFNEPISKYSTKNNLEWMTQMSGSTTVQTPTTENYMKNLFEALLLELNSKEDLKSTQDGNSRMNKFHQAMMLMMGGNSSVDMSKMKQSAVRYLPSMSTLFKFHGVELYKNHVLPFVKAKIDEGLEKSEHPNIIKGLLADFIGGFLKTCKYFYQGNEKLYNDSFILLHSVLGENEQLEQTSYLKETLCDAFKNSDPIRFDTAINLLIDEVSLNSVNNTKNTLLFFSYLMEAFHWKFMPYASKLVSKILEYDFSSLSLPKNIEDVTKPSQALLVGKSWTLIANLFESYINKKQRFFPEVEDENITKIHIFLSNALKDIEAIQVPEEQQLQSSETLLIANTLTSMVDFLSKLCKNSSTSTLPYPFIELTLKVGLVGINKSVQNEIIYEATDITHDCLNKLQNNLEDGSDNSHDSLTTVKEFTLRYIKDENWRVRKRAVNIIEEIANQLSKRNQLDNMEISDVLALFDDDNIFVIKAAISCLRTLLSGETERIEKLISEWRPKANDQAKKASSSKNKEDTKSLFTSLNVLLSCVYACEYSLPEFLPRTCLFLHSCINSWQEARTDIKEYITRFKSIHQQVVQEHPQRFSEEQLEVIKEVFAYSSSQSIA